MKVLRRRLSFLVKELDIATLATQNPSTNQHRKVMNATQILKMKPTVIQHRKAMNAIQISKRKHLRVEHDRENEGRKHPRQLLEMLTHNLSKSVVESKCRRSIIGHARGYVIYVEWHSSPKVISLCMLKCIAMKLHSNASIAE